MAINWDILQPVDIAGRTTQGFAQGVALGREARRQSAFDALAKNPNDPAAVNALWGVGEGATALKIEEIQRERLRREALGRVFSTQPSAFGGSGIIASPEERAANQDEIAAGLTTVDGPPPPMAMTPEGLPPVGPQAPAALVDPAQLPPRTDGMVINHDALRQLYAIDPDTAMGIQKQVFEANKQQLELAQKNGEQLASVAFRLKQLPPEARAAELSASAPMLAQIGIDPSLLANADLSDAGLDRYLMIGQSYKDLASQAREEARFEETKRHNRATEGNAAAGLAVRQGALGLARERSARAAKNGGGSDDNSDLNYLLGN